MEQEVVKSYLDSGRLLSYHRYADDCIIIIKKNSVRSFLNEINSFDMKLKFTQKEMNFVNEIIFLDTKIYIHNAIVEFKRYRKKGHYTVISNFRESLMSMKYLKGNIFTALHRERDACSTHEIFLESLEELKTVFYRNLYPMALIEARIKRFLQDDQKRAREPTDISIVFEYSSPNIEQYICRLTYRMSNILPNFRVNVCYRTIKLTKIFSAHAKEKLHKDDMCNAVYKYLCPCNEFYIGQTKRLIQTRAGEHQRQSNNTHVYQHMSTCPTYIRQASEYALNYKNNYTSPQKAKFIFFKSRFSIIEKGFRNEYTRRKCEAYHIRLQRPKINDQLDLKAFTLF